MKFNINVCSVRVEIIHHANQQSIAQIYTLYSRCHASGSRYVDTDKLTTANGGTFTSSSASRSSQSR